MNIAGRQRVLDPHRKVLLPTLKSQVQQKKSTKITDKRELQAR